MPALLTKISIFPYFFSTSSKFLFTNSKSLLITAPISPGVEERENCRPMLSDIRDSDVLEDYGDIIVMLYRDEYYDPNTEDRGIAELIVTTHRNGPVGTVKLLFEPQYIRYRNLAA